MRFALFCLLLACWSASAGAQPSAGQGVLPLAGTAGARPAPPDVRMPPGDYRQPPGPVRNGLIGALPIGRNAEVAIGRFAVFDVERPRADSVEIRRRTRGIAAIGVSLKF